MEFIAVTVNGIEEITIQEIKESINEKAEKITKGRIKFSTTEDKVKELIYITRSVNKIYKLEKEIKFKDLNDVINALPDIKIKGNFKVECLRLSKYNFSSQEAEKKIGEFYFNKGYKVDLEKPETVIYAELIDNLCLLGIDLTRKELQKRDYRIKMHNQSPNALVAYAMIRLSKWNNKEILLDPFCKDGVIPIEAALFASNIPRGYFNPEERIEKIDKRIKKDKLNIIGYDSLLHNVRSCEINSKLADVNKLINFSKIDVDWLDVKLKKESVDKIITVPPFASKDKNPKDAEKQYKQLFHQAGYILKKDGILIILAHRPELIKKYSEKFKPIKEVKTIIGDMELVILVYER